MDYIISPIAIDLGAADTGVHNTHGYLDGHGMHLQQNTGACIRYNAKKIQFLQVKRTATRHRLRGLQRRKLVKRLFLCFCVGKGLERNRHRQALNFIYGLLNRRGYTYEANNLSEDFKKEDLSQELFVILSIESNGSKDLYSYLLKNIAQLSEQDELLEKWLDDLNNKEYQEQLQENLGCDTKTASKWLKNLADYFQSVLEAREQGAKHRNLYLQNMSHDLKEALKGRFDEQSKNHHNHQISAKLQGFLQALDLDSVQLYQLLGNIGNLPLRTLRKYFNKKSFIQNELFWHGEHLGKLLHRSLESWHIPKENTEDCAARKSLQEKLKQATPEAWLCQIDPRQSIPPFEDQNNRNPPQCATLYLNPRGLDKSLPGWELMAEKFSAADKKRNPFACVDLGQFIAPLDSQTLLRTSAAESEERLKKARILQRVLDASKALDPYQIRALCFDPKNQSDEKLQGVLAPEECRDFLGLAQQYYREVKLARSGMWSGERDAEHLLFQCGNNPPQKHKLAHIFINNILGSKLPEAQAVEILRQNFWSTEKIGNSYYKGFCGRVEELRKAHGNLFRNDLLGTHWAQEDPEKEVFDQKLGELLETVKSEDQGHYFSRLLDYLASQGWYNKPLVEEEPSIWQHCRQLYILTQLYNILETDIQGFSKDCQWCAMENSWRMKQHNVASPDPDKELLRVARTVRLVKNGVRPFDGFVARYLERIADEVVKLKMEQLSEAKEDKVYVPILIEQNQFDFEESLEAAKKLQGKTRAKKAKFKPGDAEARQESRMKSKTERIQSAGKGLCPYCGKPIPEGGGDMDHIVPRSWSMKHHNTVFNSEPNLIYTHTQCNRFGKQNKIFTLAELSPSYLKAQFGQASTQEIGQEIYAVVQPYRAGKNFINFLSLSPDVQLHLRHALFIPELRSELLPLLKLRNKIMVNGTQAYLAKRIRQKLAEEGQKQGKEFFCHSFQIPVTDGNWTPEKNQPKDDAAKRKEMNMASICVKGSRALLGLENAAYNKQSKQEPSSHIIDAAMVLATVLRDPKLLEEVLQQGQLFLGLPYSELEELCQRQAEQLQSGQQTMQSLLPPLDKQLDLQRRNIKDGKHIWEKAVFKETIYGEDFHPLVLKPDGKLYYGFIELQEQSGPEQPNQVQNKFLKAIKIRKKQNPEQLFAALSPFLRLHKKQLKYNFAEYQEQAKQRPIFFTVHKQSYFQFCEDVFYSKNGHDLQALSPNEQMVLACLQAMRYNFARGDGPEKKAADLYFTFTSEQRQKTAGELQALYDRELKEQRALYEEIITYIRDNDLHNKATWDQDNWDFIKTKKAQLLWGGVFKGSNQLYSLEELKELRLDKIDQDEEQQKYPDKMKVMVQQKLLQQRKISQRKHKAVPTKLTYKQKANPSGTLLRTRRKDAQGRPIFQTLVGGDNQISFSVVKGLQEGRKVLLSELSKNQNITPVEFVSASAKPVWMPYKKDMAFDMEQRDTSPYEVSLASDALHKDKIEKIVCNPKTKKESQWDLQLYFTEQNFLDFHHALCAEEMGGQDGQDFSFKTDEDAFVAYFRETQKKSEPKNISVKAEYTQQDLDKKKKPEPKSISVKVVQDLAGHFIAKLPPDPASVRNCFDLRRAEEKREE